MAHDLELETATLDARAGLDDGYSVSRSEARSWEPPCWPSDEYGVSGVAQRAIGWRGAARFLPFAVRH